LFAFNGDRENDEMAVFRYLDPIVLHALEVLEAIGNAKAAQPTIAFQSATVRVNLKLC
jgi:hypothetical protein